MRVLVVANGEIRGWEQIPAQHLSAELVIAVDGGWQHCQALAIKPDVVIGDFDSLPDAALQQIQAAQTHQISHPAEKDQIDLELALIYATEQGGDEITIIGGLGGRFDMSMANITLLLHPKLQALSIEFWHQGQKVWLIQPPGDEIVGQAGDTLSLLPIGGAASGVQTSNLAYPLENQRLQMGFSRGVSNLLMADTAQVFVESGALLAIWTHGRA